MPSYEYECRLCKAKIELIQSLDKHETPEVCPSCNMKHTLIRVNIPSSNNNLHQTQEHEE